MNFVYVYYKFQGIRTLINILFRILKMGKIIFADVLRGFQMSLSPEFFNNLFFFINSMLRYRLCLCLL